MAAHQNLVKFDKVREIQYTCNLGLSSDSKGWKGDLLSNFVLFICFYYGEEQIVGGKKGGKRGRCVEFDRIWIDWNDEVNIPGDRTVHSITEKARAQLDVYGMGFCQFFNLKERKRKKSTTEEERHHHQVAHNALFRSTYNTYFSRHCIYIFVVLS